MKVFFSFFLMLFLFSCDDHSEQPAENTLRYIELSNENSNMASNILVKTTQIINSQNQLDLLYMNSNSNYISIPEVDFDEKIVLLIHAGEKNSLGYGIKIDNIEQLNNEIIVHYIETSPGISCSVEHAFSYPYMFIAIDRTDKEIKFSGKNIEVCMEGSGDIIEWNNKINISDISILDCNNNQSDSNIKEPNIQIVNDSEMFTRLYAETTLSITELPIVNFDTMSVIAINAGRKMSSGHRFELEQLYEENNKLHISINNISPSEGCSVDTAITYPYCFISIPKTLLSLNSHTVEKQFCDY